ncbi:MAG: MBL fold metallo-hydrolase [Eubacteriales bacterium]
MRITFMGAAETVTGSCYLVETEQTSFLVDCGMHQGQAIETRLNRVPFPFDINQIDFMLLTHAHIDHSGRIPKLFVDGFNKDIYATKATVELCGIMLPDSGHIQEMEQEWQSRKNTRADKPAQDPLYTMQDGIDACGLFKKVLYDTEFSPAPDVRVIMRDAGHILGSAILEIWIKENNGKGGEETKIVFSGDLGNKGVPIMRDPTVIDGTDYLVIESTYGDRLHENSVNKVDRFVNIINETIARGGNVIIPSFAIGRTQEIIYELNREEEKYKDQRSQFMQTPVYVDSPLAVNATRIFRENEDCFDEEARQYITNGDNPLDFPNLHFTASAEESKALNMSQESKIIISASGMCDAGRIKHHLKHNLWRKDSAVIFVGYQAIGTLGRRLVDGADKVRIFDEEIAVKARIESIEGFSGHADRDGLLEWIGAMKNKPSRIMLVHGEPEVIVSFSRAIAEKFGIETHIPKLDETVELGGQVSREKTVTVRRELPAQAPLTAVISPSIDDLERVLLILTEQCKKDLKSAETSEERSKILERYKILLKRETDEMLAGMLAGMH